jgi:hypothetical protein
MAKRVLNWWVRTRHNPQLGTYYVAMGQMSKARAKEWMDKSLYGSNSMEPYPTEEEYNARLKQLRDAGERIQ